MPSIEEQLQVPGHPDYLPDLREFANKVGAKYNLPEKLINTFKLAIDEAATNIIKHAYRNYQNSIIIQALVRRQTVTFVLIDQGTFFDPSWADEPDPSNAAELGQRPPLGIFMLRKLMDKIEYVRTNAGNELRLTKNRTTGRVSTAWLRHAVYFSVALTAATIAILFYFRDSVDEDLTTEYYDSGKHLVQQVTDKIQRFKPDLMDTDEGRLYVKAQLQPIYENNIWQVFDLAAIDTTGKILWSTRTAQMNQPFSRPESTHITQGIFTYLLEGVPVYEFEQRVTAENQNSFSGSVHVFLLQEYLSRQIELRKLSYLKRASVLLGMSYLLIALLGYLIQYRLGKVTALKKSLFNKFTFDPIQQPAPISEAGEENFLKVIEKLKTEKVPGSLPPVDPPETEAPQEPFDTSPQAKSRKPENPEQPDTPVDEASRREPENSLELEQTTLLLPQPAQNGHPSENQKDNPKIPKGSRRDPVQPCLTLSNFLAFMNEKKEIASLCGVSVNGLTNETASPPEPRDRAPARKSFSEEFAKHPESDCETAATTESESASKPPSEKQRFGADDISDSLVDDLFNDYVRKIDAPSERDEKEPVNSKPDKEGDDKSSSTGKKKIPEKEYGKGEQQPTAEAPGFANPESEIEAKSLLVESITDLLAKIKKPDSPEIPASEGASVASGETKTDVATDLEPDDASRRPDHQEENPDRDPVDCMTRGIADYREKHYEDAIIAFRNFLKIEPENRDALVLLGNSYYRNNMTNEALATYEILKKKYPGESMAHENLGLIYAGQGLQSLAIKEWKAALGLNPKRTDLMEKINVAANGSRDSKQADNDIKNLQKNDGSNTIKEEQARLLAKGITCYRNKDFEEAIQVFESLTQIYPTFEEAYGFLGTTYFRSNRLPEAQTIFEKLLPLRIENASTHENLGLIYARQGAYDQALQEWKKVLTLAPDRTDIEEKINQVPSSTDLTS